MIIKWKVIFFSIASATLATWGQISFNSYGPVLARVLYFSVIDRSSTAVSTYLPPRSLSEMLAIAIWVNVLHDFQRNKKPSVMTAPNRNFFYTFGPNFLCPLPSCWISQHTHIKTNAPISVLWQHPRPRYSLPVGGRLCGKPQLCWQHKLSLISFLLTIWEFFFLARTCLYFTGSPESHSESQVEAQNKKRLSSLYRRVGRKCATPADVSAWPTEGRSRFLEPYQIALFPFQGWPFRYLQMTITTL